MPRPAKHKPLLVGTSPEFETLPAPASHPDKPPAASPENRQGLAGLPEGTVDPSIREGFNTTGQVIDNTKPQTSQQFIEEQRVAGDPTARDTDPAVAAQQKEKAAAIHKFRKRVDSMYHRLERLMNRTYEFGIPKQEQALGKTIWYKLRDAIPDFVKPPELYKSCFYKYTEESAVNVGMIKLSEEQKRKVKASETYKIWNAPMRKLNARFWKWYGGDISSGKRPENPNPDAGRPSAKRRPTRQKDDR